MCSVSGPELVENLHMLHACAGACCRQRTCVQHRRKLMTMLMLKQSWCLVALAVLIAASVVMHSLQVGMQPVTSGNTNVSNEPEPIGSLGHTTAQAEHHSDFIIVGGGTAGCALAARLCQALPDMHFTLLERGKPRNAQQERTVRAVRLGASGWDDPGLAERFDSEPNQYLEPAGRAVDVLTGATLGGSSAINAAQWTLPDPSVSPASLALS